MTQASVRAHAAKYGAAAKAAWKKLPPSRLNKLRRFAITMVVEQQSAVAARNMVDSSASAGAAIPAPRSQDRTPQHAHGLSNDEQALVWAVDGPWEVKTSQKYSSQVAQKKVVAEAATSASDSQVPPICRVAAIVIPEMTMFTASHPWSSMTPRAEQLFVLRACFPSEASSNWYAASVTALNA
eukprot:CAMPEP_0179083750 /NCGR_PEP_ID=MMETSP0796-20121207/37837_1 /TAXON_ID=73915 /ORGANISM="Pyrodinium bahamense, Strain pbaha01" /LENGTH=182 /DNA_ID=CAMNT_0020781163 /DNA_START=251 /DNA_END=802 /DNA_ORIENTATION=+